MRPILHLPVLLALNACTDSVTAPQGDLRIRQQAACAATIAAHIRRPVSEVRARWLSEAAGIATVETMDGNRRHLCRADGSARVISYVHPQG